MSANWSCATQSSAPGRVAREPSTRLGREGRAVEPTLGKDDGCDRRERGRTGGADGTKDGISVLLTGLILVYEVVLGGLWGGWFKEGGRTVVAEEKKYASSSPGGEQLIIGSDNLRENPPQSAISPARAGPNPPSSGPRLSTPSSRAGPTIHHAAPSSTLSRADAIIGPPACTSLHAAVLLSRIAAEQHKSQEVASFGSAAFFGSSV